MRWSTFGQQPFIMKKWIFWFRQDLRTFDNGIISGYDNPKYKPKMIQFDLRIERIEEKTNITKINKKL